MGESRLEGKSSWTEVFFFLQCCNVVDWTLIAVSKKIKCQVQIELIEAACSSGKCMRCNLAWDRVYTPGTSGSTNSPIGVSTPMNDLWQNSLRSLWGQIPLRSDSQRMSMRHMLLKAAGAPICWLGHVHYPVAVAGGLRSYFNISYTSGSDRCEASC